MRVHALIVGVFIVAVALVAEAILHTAVADLVFGAIGLPVLLLIAYPVLAAPPRRYRAWGYRIDAEELHIAHGVWTRVEPVVPLARVQHIAVSQGPIGRNSGVSLLVLHTADTLPSWVVLPATSRRPAGTTRP